MSAVMRSTFADQWPFKHVFPSGNRKAGIQGTGLLQGDDEVLILNQGQAMGV